MTITTIVQLCIANRPDQSGRVFTAEAAASLIGQQPRFLVGLDWSRGGPKATVVDAGLVGENLLVTLDVDERALEGLDMGNGPIYGGLGYVPEAFTASCADDVAVAAARALTIGPVVEPPVLP